MAKLLDKMTEAGLQPAVGVHGITREKVKADPILGVFTPQPPATRLLRIRRIARALAQPHEWYDLSIDRQNMYLGLAERAHDAVEHALTQEFVKDRRAQSRGRQPRARAA